VASNIGPMFFITATAPFEWNERSGVSVGEAHRYVKTSHGMGYEVYVSSKKLLGHLDSGEESSLFLAQVIREDAETLFAFASLLERKLFIEIKDIDGIGAKFAATAVLELGVEGVVMMLESSAALPQKLPGLGPKTLEKIKNGIKAKREKFAAVLKKHSFTLDESGVSSRSQKNSYAMPTSLVFQALTQLGLRSDEVENLYAGLLQENPDVSEFENSELIKLLLKRRAQLKNNSLKNNSKTIVSHRSEANT